MDEQKNKYAERARALFLSGLNCAQAVAVAFSEATGLDEKTMSKVAVGFGGGLARLREVCGALSGSMIALGCIKENEGKQSVYVHGQELAYEFREKNGSIICRELLGLGKNAETSPVPEQRTEKYYKKRPCADIVTDAAKTLSEYLDLH